MASQTVGDRAFPAYTIAIARQLSAQFARFATLNPHQLAGHVANLDFWSDEVAHCLDVLDGYNDRFDRLAAAEREHVSRYLTIEIELDDEWGDTAKTPPRPRRIPDRERSAARSELCESYYRFLARCCRAGLIADATARQECKRYSISIDPCDLRG